MRKFFVFLLLAFIASSFASQSSNTIITYHVETLPGDEIARNLQSELLNGYKEKITKAVYNLTKKEFIFSITENFNRTEILGFFRDRGYEAYYTENGSKYMLNERGNDVVRIRLYEKSAGMTIENENAKIEK